MAHKVKPLAMLGDRHEAGEDTRREDEGEEEVEVHRGSRLGRSTVPEWPPLDRVGHYAIVWLPTQGRPIWTLRSTESRSQGGGRGYGA